MDINFEYYKIFYYVARYGNITKAAGALGSSQPNVTRVMKLLEAQLNCRLFVREARGISLTEEGERLYSHVEVACRHLLDAQEEIYLRGSQSCGTVEIGTTETALHLFLINVLRDFKLEYPGIRIRIHNHTTPETIKYLVGGRVDLALITTPFEAPGTVSCVKALEFEEILAGGTQYAGLAEKAMKLEEVRRYPWIGLGRGSATYELYRNLLLENRLDPEPDMEVETSGLMLPLIENDLGIGFVPQKLAMPLLEEGKLVQIRLDHEIPKRTIQIASNRERRRSPAADTFYGYIMGRVQT